MSRQARRCKPPRAFRRKLPTRSAETTTFASGLELQRANAGLIELPARWQWIETLSHSAAFSDRTDLSTVFPDALRVTTMLVRVRVAA